MLSQFSKTEVDPSLLVGLETSDDAGVYKLTDDIALVQTVDFFTPVVDDPYTFGEIAAANALSDIYAMGAKPLTCMNLVGYPIGELGSEILNQMLKGGYEKIREAGAALIGGHSLEDKEPKYGLAVTGTVHPEKVWTNAGARPGDILVLTKPLGTGIITTAIKGEMAEAEAERAAIEAMITLNKEAMEVLQRFSVSACTDVTGFGLLGHSYELAKGSQVDLELWKDHIPFLPDTQKYADMGLVPGGTRKNLSFFEDVCEFDEEVEETVRLILADAITSGGLLASVAPQEVDEVEKALKDAGCLAFERIGKVKELEGDRSKIKII